MSDYTEDEFDSDMEDSDTGGDIKSLRRAANGKRKLEKELVSLRREMAFFKAGLPVDDPRMSYFIKGYDGEMNAEAIRDAAVDAGFLEVVTEEPSNAEGQAAAQNRVMQASSGVAYEGATDEAAMARLDQAMEEGGVEAMLEVARQYGIPTNTE